jgi:hypothetical protein
MIAAIIIQFSFTIIKSSNKTLPDLIDRELLVDMIMGSKIDDYEIKMVLKDYLDSYINYVFYKRSYPSIQSIDYGLLEGDRLTEAKNELITFKEKIDLEYEDVLKLRDANTFFSNSSIYLLINIGVFLIFILISIMRVSFKSGLKLTSIALIISSVLILASSVLLETNLSNMISPTIYSFVEGIFNDDLMNSIFNLALIYLSVGVVVFIIFFIMGRIQNKKFLTH